VPLVAKPNKSSKGKIFLLAVGNQPQTSEMKTKHVQIKKVLCTSSELSLNLIFANQTCTQEYNFLPYKRVQPKINQLTEA